MNGRTVGVSPWLPWPFSGWRWWTEPVRAERLAVLRIAVALVLLFDVASSYIPHIHDWFGPEALGPELFAWVSEAPRLSWSLLRGPRDPLLLALAQAVWLGSTALVLLGLWGRLSTADGGSRHPWLCRGLAAWSVATAWVVFGLGVRVSPVSLHGAWLVWGVPVPALGVATVFASLALWRRLRPEPDGEPWVWRWALLAWGVAAVLAGLGVWRAVALGDRGDLPDFLEWTGVRWHGDPVFLLGAAVAWAAATSLLVLGWWTRASAAAVWALSVSFDNLNWYVNNAGDQVRTIALFYLMLCPCGAAWSLDAWRERRRTGQVGPVLVSPWPLRLLFLQMVFIYFCNGLCKVVSPEWTRGVSLYYAWCDLTLTRFSYAQLPVPYALIRPLTWTVLAWEVAFPLLVLVKWTRVPALLLGVAFHLGIFATLELGGFAAYMLALYLPLLPWDRWLRTRGTREPTDQHASLIPTVNQRP